MDARTARTHGPENINYIPPQMYSNRICSVRYLIYFILRFWVLLNSFGPYYDCFGACLYNNCIFGASTNIQANIILDKLAIS